ncbi:hypothetical protein [Streptomyces sp. AC1-42T]|uniref:hypothetical protein n=1 Tax=Streptomyces sp. AC1-42T TaxID=2218665 RepID=UPI000DAEC635|nr:hypothetical protein [Streptomyces sp. AC1-42T]PZT71562.1 hypothetical protein DNK55_33190 [Streptomyces sp. AC1-42T]
MTTYPDDHPSVRDAGREAARRVLRTVFGGQELGPLAAQISDDIVDCVLPMIAANRITPRAEGYGEPVHWSVYNAMHLRALRAENALRTCADEHGPYCPQREAGGWDDGPKPEHPMARAYRLGATRIPEDLVYELCEATNTGRPTGWPEHTDRDGDVWAATGETHDGDTVLMPCAGEMAPLLRRDVEQHFGPLTAKDPNR